MCNAHRGAGVRARHLAHLNHFNIVPKGRRSWPKNSMYSRPCFCQLVLPAVVYPNGQGEFVLNADTRSHYRCLGLLADSKYCPDSMGALWIFKFIGS